MKGECYMDRNFSTKTKMYADPASHETIGSREYYEEVWQEFWNACLNRAKIELSKSDPDFTEDDVRETATEIFEETANAEEIAGYYVIFHMENALKDWKINTEGLAFAEKDNEVNRILETLFH